MKQTILASEVTKAMKDDKVLGIAAEFAMQMVEKELKDNEVLAVVESIKNLMYGLLKENGVEMVNDHWE